MTEKHFSYEAKTGIKYKVHASHFLGKVTNYFSQIFTITSSEREFDFVVRLPLEIALKQWKMKSREDEEEALVALGTVLVKQELDRGNEADGFEITISEQIAKKTLKETLSAFKGK